MEARISGHTRMYTLIGTPVDHSGSPAMYNYTFNRLGIDSAYLAFDITLDDVAKGIEAMKTLNVGGFNVTMPLKTAVVDYVDEISPAAKLIGACNTVKVEDDGRFIGHNTDGIGFVSNLREHGVSVEGKKIVVLGAGGAATAVTAQCALDGAAEIAIFNRKGFTFYPNGELTVRKLAAEVPACKASITDLFDTKALAAAVANCDILVNATRVGMEPLDGQSLIDPALFRSDLVVCDTVYNPRETRMIEEAKAAGCKTIGGIGMLLWQGVAAFKIYTGQDMPAQEILEKFFS